MANPTDSEELSSYSQELLDAVLRALPSWITARVRALAPAASLDLDNVIQETLSYVHKNLEALLRTDVDEQRENPLHVLRQSSMFVTAALREAGIPAVQRDEFDRQSMPDDMYAIGPLTWRDLSEEVHEAGITWGAWKAATVLTRRRAEGKLS